MDTKAPGYRRLIKDWLLAARHHARLTQRAFAEAVGASLPSIQSWESLSRTTIPRPAMIASIAIATGFPAPSSINDKFPRPTRVRTQRPSETVSEEIRAVATVLCSLVGDPIHLARDEEMFAMRYGVKGPQLSTLQAIGDLHGMTRERVRQITTRALEASDRVTLDASATLKLVAALKSIPTSDLDAANSTLRPILGPELDIRDAQRFAAEVHGVRWPRQIAQIRSQSLSGSPRKSILVADSADASLIDVARKHASAMIRNCGAASMETVCGLTIQERRSFVPRQDVVNGLSLVPGFEWLSDKEWFWFGPGVGENRIIDRASVILAAAQRPLDVEVIYSGIIRDRRHQRSDAPSWGLAPLEVIRLMLSQCPEFRCTQQDDFRLVTPCAIEERLEGSALDVYRVLEQRGGIATLSELRASLVHNGSTNRITLAATLANHPVISQIQKAVYGIRGWPIDPSRFAECLADLNLYPNPIDSSGKVRVSAVLTAGAMRNRMTGIPTQLVKAMPMGQYALDNGSSITVSPKGYARGVVPALRALGVPVGTSFTVEFDIEQRRAALFVDSISDQTNDSST